METIRVLVADDHDILRLTIAGMLRSMDGVDVVAEARNGIDAISEALRTTPDLVLLDVHMPGANGYEAAEQIKSSVPNARVAIMSVANGREYERGAVEVNADAFIEKSSLRAGIKNLIAMMHLDARPVTVAA
jgi:DNA-binding NarL/FixJ family response regulator